VPIKAEVLGHVTPPKHSGDRKVDRLAAAVGGVLRGLYDLGKILFGRREQILALASARFGQRRIAADDEPPFGCTAAPHQTRCRLQ
jgi:hypothetical protein